MTTIPQGLSVWERALYQRLTSHIESEGLLLDTYRRVADAQHSEYVTYLLNMIAEDEARHHRLYEEWANSLKNLMAPEPDGAQIPALDLQPSSEDLEQWVRSFLQFEREDQRELKDLAKQLKDVRDTTLWRLIVELMQLDTQKHIRILEFLQDHIRK